MSEQMQEFQVNLVNFTLYFKPHTIDLLDNIFRIYCFGPQLQIICCYIARYYVKK